ncbi:MAG: ABC transporter substrate-binding protein [Jatrophihabitans sp.]
MRFTRKGFISKAVVLAAATASVVSGCSSGGGSSGGKTTLTFWARSDESAFVQKIVDGFNSTHDNITVKLTIVPAANYVQKFGAAAAGGSAPDIASIDLVYVPYFAKQGALSDLSSTANGLSFKDTLSPAHMQAGKLDGKQYALPFSADASVLFYNKGLLKKAGLDPASPPKTFADIKTAADKITALGGGNTGFYLSGACGGCNAFAFLPSIWAAGGDLLQGDLGKQTASVSDSAPLKTLLQFLHGMQSAGDIAPSAKTDNGAQALQPFESGKVGMFVSGSFAYASIKQAAPKLDVGAINLYDATGSAYSSFAGGDDVAIPAGSKHKEQAKTFLTWLLQTDAQTKYLANQGVIPIRSDVSASDYAGTGPVQKVLADALNKGKSVYSLQTNALYNDANGPWTAMFQKAVFGGDIDGALKDAQAGFEKVLKS